MSGIAGIIHFDGKPVEPGLIEKMTGAMAHRGPDGINHWAKGSVALGQCMLRTTPESLEEHQPLTNEDESLVLVMDGRVDNWEELRRELLGRGAVLRNRADAELVLRAYEIWGRECLTHIDGDFALVIWDARRREAFCARDRVGNKPFHYHWSGSTLAFTSELPPILALPWVEQEPNEGMLAEFLAGEWCSRDETLWTRVMRLVAAHRMEVDRRGPRPEQYWTPDLWAVLPYKTDQDYIDHYRELLFDSVRRLSRSHRTVACELSGGLDSSAIFCVAERLRRAGKLPAPGIEAYTLAFTDDNAANEVIYARAVGEYLGVPIHEVTPYIPPLSWYSERGRVYSGCPAFPNGVMLQTLRKLASENGCRVILNGIGGDEWMGGSRLYYAEELAKRQWLKIYDCIRGDLSVFGAKRTIGLFVRHGCVPLLPLTLQNTLRLCVRSMRKGRANEHYWLSPAMRATIRARRARFNAGQLREPRSVGQRELFELLHAAHRYRGKEEDDVLSAGFGMETRSPLDTFRIAQHAFSTPERLRLRGDVSKIIHRQALRKVMPATILERRTNSEFSVVFRYYLDHLKEAFTRDIPGRRQEWVAPEGMARLFGTYRDRPELGWPMWPLWLIYSCDNLLPRRQNVHVVDSSVASPTSS